MSSAMPRPSRMNGMTTSAEQRRRRRAETAPQRRLERQRDAGVPSSHVAEQRSDRRRPAR